MLCRAVEEHGSSTRRPVVPEASRPLDDLLLLNRNNIDGDTVEL